MPAGWAFPTTEIVATRGDEQYRLDAAIFDGERFPYARDLVSPLLRYDGDRDPSRIDRSVARRQLVAAGPASDTAHADAMLAYAVATDCLVVSDGAVVILHDEPPADEELSGALNTAGILLADIAGRLEELLSAASASVSGLEDRREAADTDAERADIDKQLQELRLGIENLSDTVDRLEIQRERLARWYDVGDVGSRDREQFEGTRDFLAELATTVPEDTDIDREMDTERVMDMIQTVTSAVASVVTVTDPGEDTVAEAESLLDDPEL